MKSPIITVIGSLSFASGCLTVASNVDNLTAGGGLTARGPALGSVFANQILACLAISWPLLLTISLAGYTALLLAQRPVAARVLLILPLVAMTYAIWRLPRPANSDLWYSRNAGNIECLCKVDSIKGSNSLICSPIELRFPSRKQLNGKTTVTVYGGKQKLTYRPEQTLLIFGKVSQIERTQSSWQRNHRRTFVSEGVFSKLSADFKDIKAVQGCGNESRSITSERATTPDNMGNGSRTLFTTIETNWQQFWQRGRQEIIKAHTNSLGSDKGNLLSSMVLGDRVVRLPKELKALFRSVGLSHLLAASGFNLSIVVASSYFLARLLPVPPYCASLFALLSTASFVFLAGPSPSVVRAAILCVLFLTAKLFCRRLHSLAALSLTLSIALIADPLCASDVGLQLSYLATAGIISGLQWVSSKPVTGLRQRLTQWLIDTASVICLAQLSVLPLQLLYFQNTGVLFLPANLLVDPVVAPVTVLGFLSSMIAFTISLFPFGITGGSLLIELIDKLTSLSLDYMIYCASILASIKGTTVHLGPPIPAAVPVYYLCLSYFLYTLPISKMRMVGALVLLVGLCTILFRPNMPGEVLFLSKESAIAFQNKQASIVNCGQPDWLGKQLLAYAGADNIKPLPGENRISQFDLTMTPTTRARRRAKKRIVSTATASAVYEPAATISIAASREFLLIAQISKEGKSKDAATPLTWGQTQVILALLRNEASSVSTALAAKKPILLWTRGGKTGLRQCPDLKNVYIASVSWNAIVVSRNLLRSKKISHDSPASFYPFQVKTTIGDLLLLR